MIRPSALTEADIPGASLDIDPATGTVIQLKRWLACRKGASTSGTKSELVNRVNDYINGGLSEVLLTDPDVGVNTKEKQDRGGVTSCPAISTLSTRFHHPPKEGWTSDLSQVPGGVSYGAMWNFLVNQPHLKEKAKGCDRQFGKGYRLYCSGHVTEIMLHPMSAVSSFLYLKATVLPSMKKTKTYTSYISVWQSTHQIHSAYCTCPAGLSGICCHVAAFLYACSGSTIPSNVNACQSTPSCTSRPQQWLVPSRKRKVDNFPIHEALFEKHDPTKPKKRTPKTRQIDPRPIHLQKNNRDKVHQLRQKLEDLKSQGKSCAFLHVLPFAPSLLAISSDHDYAASESTDSPTTCDNSNQLPIIETTVAPSSSNTVSSHQSNDSLIITSTSFGIHAMHNYSKLQTMPDPSEKLSHDEDFKTMCRKYEMAQKLTIEEVEHIEQSTRGQSSNENWYKHRQEKVTASVVGTIINKRKTTPPDNLLKRIMGYENQTFISKACKHGIECEQTAADAYAEYMKMNGHLEISLKEAGFAVLPESSWLGASVDRVVDDPLSEPSEGNVEIKCPASNLTIAELAIQRGSSFPLHRDTTSELKLKHHHVYYYQIQCQLGVTKRAWCDFVMYTLTPKGEDIHVERIMFDKKAWRHNIFPKVKEFYIGSVVPEILTRRIKHGFPLFPELFEYKNTKANKKIEE